jgi:hypothetical protein
MEYLSIQVTPSPVRGWVAHPHIKTTMPTAQGHPRTLRTLPEVELRGLRGLDIGTVTSSLTLLLQSAGTMPFCARCAAALGFGEDGS